ncbi:MAG: TonB-dependent receptor [Saprospiraceae bacterium]|nr:TonB-dependent receptor [Saprospiraceae bacterium]MCB9322510.1 TonB-dependent receptor [Lewinellaceae bacterium]
MNKVKLLLLFFFSIVLTLPLTAGSMDPDANGKIKGKVIDQQSKNPIEYATITVYNTVDSSIVTGTISDYNGDFEITNLNAGLYFVEITFLGFEMISRDAIEVEKGSKAVDLGEIRLSPDKQTLKEVVVLANQNSVEYQIDKKVVTVSEQMTSASMSAVEVLENIPSIKVDFEGNVLLRGSSGFTVLIDGKPTVLDPSDVLRQTPASTILNIEIITNPSSRYQPDGTGGIINIVTKKSRMLGFNGLLNLNGGVFGSYGGDFLVNYKREKTNYYVSADYGYQPFPGESYSDRLTTIDGISTRIVSEGKSERLRNNQGLRAGFDWDISDKDLFSLGLRMGKYNRGGSSELDYLTTQEADNFSMHEFSINESGRSGNYYNMTGSYLHKFNNDQHELSLQLNYRARKGDEYSENVLKDEGQTITSGAQTTEKGPSNNWEMRLDYTRPIGSKNMFETGLQLRRGFSVDETELFLYDTDIQDFVLQQDKGNSINYDRKIYALYGIYKGSWNKFGYQAGLRGEYTYRDIQAVELNKNFTINRWDLFPSVHFSYQLPKENQVMANYSRRIDRPHGWALEPFLSWSDLFNVRRGNPELKPEYIDALEMSYLKSWEKSSLSLEAYYRIKHNKIERILEVYDEETFLTTFANVGKDYSLGLEAMYNYTLFKWWELNLMGNLYDYRIVGQLDELAFENSSFNWSGRINNTFKLTQDIRFQLDYDYNSPSITAQGETKGYYAFNLALRSDFFDKKLSAVLQVRDVFGTRKRISIVEDANFYNYRSWRNYAPMVSLSLSYRFNNYNPMEKKGENGNDNGNNNGEGGF